jgi:hypothetical protein
MTTSSEHARVFNELVERIQALGPAITAYATPIIPTRTPAEGLSALDLNDICEVTNRAHKLAVILRKLHNGDTSPEQAEADARYAINGRRR